MQYFILRFLKKTLQGPVNAGFCFFFTADNAMMVQFDTSPSMIAQIF